MEKEEIRSVIGLLLWEGESHRKIKERLVLYTGYSFPWKIENVCNEFQRGHISIFYTRPWCQNKGYHVV